MREIKFRAWSINAGEFFTPQILGKVDPRNEWTIIEQYTGLKDKNGKEVYEGDLLRWNNKVLLISVCDFHGYRFQWGDGILVRCYAEDGEVVGNIHEHPDLLEQP